MLKTNYVYKIYMVDSTLTKLNEKFLLNINLKLTSFGIRRDFFLCQKTFFRAVYSLKTDNYHVRSSR